MLEHATATIKMERQVLSVLLAQPDRILDVADKLSAWDFYTTDHQNLWLILKNLHETKSPINPVTVYQEMERRGNNKPTLISELIDEFITTEGLEFYIREVKKRAGLRKLIVLGERLSDSAKRSDADLGEILTKATHEINDIVTDGGEGEEVRDFRDLLPEILKEIEKRYESGAGIDGVTSGFSALDEITGGFQGGDFIVLAARPSIGKTALALSFALAADRPVLLFSLEMPTSQIMNRLLSITSNIEAHRIRRGRFGPESWKKIVAAAENLSSKKVFIDDRAGNSISNIRLTASRAKLRHGIGLIIIDYLQLIHSPRGESREREVAAISRTLKGLARELGIPVITLAQLNRTPENRQDKEPRLSDLRDSGSIEQDADLVLMIYREELYQHTPENDGIAQIGIAKHRNGPIGVVQLRFDKERATFQSMRV